MTTETVIPETITNNTYHEYLHDLNPYHWAHDCQHLENLTVALATNGWSGPPLVKFDNQLLTGSHRWQAAKDAEFTIVPVVDYLDIFSVDEEEIIEIVENSDNWEVELTYIALKSDPELAAYLGMDIH